MPKAVEENFLNVLIQDVNCALERLSKNDTPTHRREFIRAISAAVEGLHWRVKSHLFDHSRDHLSLHEQLAMIEEGYNVDDDGDVRVRPQRMPLAHAIRLVIKVTKRIRPSCEFDFNHPGWTCLKDTIAVRHRLVHPKRIEELTVTDQELVRAFQGFVWFLALGLQVLDHTIDYLKGRIAKLKEWAELPKGAG